MARIVNDFPMRPVRHLDHVSATPLTCLKRALFLARNYELRGATVLSLGDLRALVVEGEQSLVVLEKGTLEEEPA